MSVSGCGAFTVGDWRVEPEFDRISGDAGCSYLRPQVMELLVYLARNKHRLISADELLDDLWAGKVVTSGSVYNCVAELRNALNRGSAGQSYIQTIPKKGYRLLAEVTGLGEANGAVDRERASAPVPGRAAITSARNVALALLVILGLVLAVGLSTDVFSPQDRAGEAQRYPPLRRFTIDLPGSMQVMDNSFRPVTISGDGRRVLFNADTDGQPRLFSRAIDSLVARPIRGTENAARVHSFSPDGEWIAFFDRRESSLKKIPVAGGVPVALCEPTAGATNIVWSPNDDIVIATRDYAGLMRVPASGGVPEPLTRPAADEFHKHPGFSADGKTLLFTIGERGVTMRKTDQIAAVSLATGERKVLMAGSSPTLLPDGYLVYFDRNALWAVEFDADRLEVTSDAVPVADDVHYHHQAHYSVSRDGTLVHVLATNLVDRSLVWVDESGNEAPLSMERRPYYGPRISPDGQSIAVVVDAEGGADLWTYSLARGTWARLTFDESRETSPLWSPDGRYIYYSSNRIDDLFRVAAIGVGTIDQLTDTPQYEFPTSVSSDGSTILFNARGGSRGSSDIMELTLSEVPAARTLLQTEFAEFDGTFSPDGRWITYQSDRSGRIEVYLRPYPDVDADRWQVSVGGGRNAFWDPNGSRLFYSGPSHLMSVRVDLEHGPVIGTPEPLFELDDFMHLGNFGFDRDHHNERFLMLKKPSDEELPDNRIVVVQNWLEFVAASLASD